ncbi:MAG: hypothetical protein JSS26_17580 [Nitrospira sp.]|nr:hypothetical protein [Nitrospira sp.]
MAWHRHFKPNPKPSLKSPVFLVFLDVEGNIQRIEPLTDRERTASIRKWEVANGLSFPSFNVAPLYQVSNAEEGRKRVAEFRKVLFKKSSLDSKSITATIQALINDGICLWVEKDKNKLSKCFQGVSKDVRDLLGQVPPEFMAVKELVNRTGSLETETFLNGLRSYFVDSLSEHPETAKDFFDALFFYPKNSRTKPGRITLILELADQSSFEFPANHSKTQAWMNERFLASEKSSSSTGADIDAYGKPLTGWKDKFPSSRLSTLGNVILRAMSKESPCQQRYRSIDAGSCPVGNESRKAMKRSLEWLAAHERKGQTWADVSSVSGGEKTPTVLFAYPSKLPQQLPAVAQLFAGPKGTSESQEALFAACAKRVADSLSGDHTSSFETVIRVFVLKKADTARTKLLYHGRYQTEHLLRSAKEWELGCQNTPTVKIRELGGDAEPIWQPLLTPFPAEVVWCLNTVWARHGTHAERTRNFSIGDGLNLLLDTRVQQEHQVSRALNVLVRQSASLLLAIGQAQNRNQFHRMPSSNTKQARLLPSILGLLLYKSGHRKGVYMHVSPFLIGRLLSLADQLHQQYCLKVRKGSMPSQLVGNALMPIALEQPTQALALLSQRILPYQAWARTVQGNDVGLVKFFLGEMGKLCNEFASLPLPEGCDDAAKAQMLLGYLARTERSDDSSAGKQTQVA